MADNNSKIDKIKERQSKTTVNRKLRMRSKQDVDYTLDGSIKQLFLNLTRMQIPFNYEQTLSFLFPNNMETDAHGNYYTKIGETKTMFCGHLDTYCYEFKRVFHIIEGDVVKTDGTTTLGGDDKAGIAIMIKMIEAGIPGLYYFFRGEEGVTSPTGTWGSKQALKTYEELFKKYERCIAFDRRGTKSVITQQMYGECCSNEFASDLVDAFNANGMDFEEDPTGMWCDSGVFMDLIPECTNISIGYENEHTFHEEQDLIHLEKLLNACINIEWEKLPTKRDPFALPVYGVDNYKYNKNNTWNKNNIWDRNYALYDDYEEDEIYDTKSKNKFNVKKYKSQQDLFEYVCNILYDISYESLNPTDFNEGEEMYFQNYQTKDFFALKIVDYDIYITDDETLRSYEFIGDIDTFESYIKLGSEYSEKEDKKDNIKNTKNDNIDEFSNKQIKIYSEFVTNNADILSKIINDVLSTNKKVLSSSMWLEVDKAMTKYGIKLDYDFNGINPDDLVDWIYYNWDKCEKIKKDYEKDQKEMHTKYIFNNKTDGGTKFSKTQISAYSDITINKKPSEVLLFIKQVIDKNLFTDPKNKQIYEQMVKDWLNIPIYKDDIKEGELSPHNFILWIMANTDEIKDILDN